MLYQSLQIDEISPQAIRVASANGDEQYVKLHSCPVALHPAFPG